MNDIQNSVDEYLYLGSTNNENNIYNDKFYENVYDYYYKGGLCNIVISNILEILFLIFGIFFGIFIFVILDINKLLLCGKENQLQDCGEITIYINKNINPGLFSILFISILISITIYKIIFFISTYDSIYGIKKFYRNTLQITQKDLQILQWKHIINALSEHTYLDIYEITNKILRKENYKIAFLNENIIKVPAFLYTKQLDMNIDFIIINDLENINRKKLKYKFILFGILNLIFSFFIFIFILIYFFISNIDELHSNTKKLGSKRYSFYYKSKLRKYNEVKHFFENRLNKSIKYAYIYINQFPSPILEIIGKFIALICGTFIGLFLIFSILDESILLYVRYLDRSLIFYTGIISLISANARSFIVDPENKIYNPKEAIKKLDSYIHFLPLSSGSENMYDIKDEFLCMFKYNIILFFYDLVSVITTPYIMIFILSKQSDEIYEFIVTNTIKHKNIGKICKFSEFNSKNKNILMEKSISIFGENNILE